MRNVTLLYLIARIHPELWDVIIPCGPVIRTGSALAERNPQPLPPEPPPDRSSLARRRWHSTSPNSHWTLTFNTRNRPPIHLPN